MESLPQRTGVESLEKNLETGIATIATAIVSYDKFLHDIDFIDRNLYHFLAGIGIPFIIKKVYRYMNHRNKVHIERGEKNECNTENNPFLHYVIASLGWELSQGYLRSSSGIDFDQIDVHHIKHDFAGVFSAYLINYCITVCKLAGTKEQRQKLRAEISSDFETEVQKIKQYCKDVLNKIRSLLG